MKKIITTMAALSVVSIAAPAAAQYRGGNLDNRIEHLQDRLQQGVQRGTISRGEAMPLRDRLRQLTRLERQFSRGGFSRNEQRILQQRIQSLRQQIHYAERSRGGYDRHDRDDRDDRHDRDDDRRDGRRGGGR